MRERWRDIQTRFVDDPREAVQEADKLVNSCIDTIAEGFRNERGRLESQWSRGKDVSTEDLRLALQHYRNFLDRMLSV